MDVAENVGNARTVENHIASGTRLVKTKVEAFSLEKRKNVMKKRVAVGEFHHRSHWHDQKMRLKALVMLCQSQAIRSPGKRFGRRSLGAWCVRKPNDSFRGVRRFGVRAVP